MGGIIPAGQRPGCFLTAGYRHSAQSCAAGDTFCTSAQLCSSSPQLSLAALHTGSLCLSTGTVPSPMVWGGELMLQAPRLHKFIRCSSRASFLVFYSLSFQRANEDTGSPWAEFHFQHHVAAILVKGPASKFLSAVGSGTRL